ncbi:MULTISPECIES: archaeosine biosynthesis radical SAM protein RaSEA [Acidiplasma]|uniref:Radical SAM protein n=3 Tax=Acidiplasma TaxID=507753 RepID=A0A0N8PQM1_9ARCH|nr:MULTISPECIES: archaeosine biosynthesis radical SAM protein RaSEA [Acidiplasma]KPV47509.1 radical SAM protein [Acidiplasma aeolicum]KQB36181.1 radical SAM protein [Acidiplasma aeolicum]
MESRELSLYIRGLIPGDKKDADANRPVSVWKELDRLRGFPEKTVVCIFRTTGCAWYRFSACSMCGYFNDTSDNIIDENLFKQVDELYNSLGDAKVVKIFTSGSFLDPREVSPSVRNYFFEKMKGKVDKILVESRTEYIRKDILEDIKRHNIPVRIAIGLESANDYIMKYSINKGSTLKKYLDAARLIKEEGFELRTYLLFKPPFISELSAIADVENSVKISAQYSNDISINPMNIQKNTLVEKLWKKGLYRPPRMISLARILIEMSGHKYPVLSYPTGGGKERGVHDDKFDKKLLDLIVKSSLEQNFSELKEYYSSLDLSLYNYELDLEDKLLLQTDYNTLVKRISRSSIFY